MCGIGGILIITRPGESHEAIPETWLDALDESFRHRGPDGAGRYRDRVLRGDGVTVEVALVHRRLSIIDHAGGAQPMISRLEEPIGGEDAVAVVFNGCLYNHRSLRAELEDAGHAFETDHSDTEVLLHAWRAFGRDAIRADPDPGAPPPLLLTRLDGMYAFAIWDRVKTSLFLARDPYGEKPLYLVNLGERRWAFGSSVPGLLDVCRFADQSRSGSERPLELSRSDLIDWLAMGYDIGTPWKGIEEVVAPGRLLSDPGVLPARRMPLHWKILLAPLIVLGVIGMLVGAYLFVFLCGLVALVLIKFWLFAPVPTRVLMRAAGIGRTRVSLQDRLDSLLDASVASRLEADVPIACFLSGGMDSSLIARYARGRLGALRTLCVRMPDEQYDESEFAAAVADHLGTDHMTVDVNASPAEDMVALIEQLGLPFGDSSLLPTYWVCRAAREHVKVALSGDGGDELFCGYDRYRAAPYLRWTRLVAPFLRTDRYARGDPRSTADKKARFIVAAKHRGYTDLLAIFPTPDRVALLGVRGGYLCQTSNFGGLPQARETDLAWYLPGDLLRKVDTASMAAGLEVRCPYLASELGEAIAEIPIRRLMLSGERKGLLRAIAYRHLPPEIVDRPKMGFAIPIGDWFRSDYGGMRTLLLDHLSSTEPFGAVHDVLDIRSDRVTMIVREHMEGERDHSQRLYALLSLSIWGRWAARNAYSAARTRTD